MRARRLTTGGRGPRSLALILLSAALPAGARELPAPVHPAVLEQLGRDGRATYWVVLREQADLAAAFRITDWDARGRHVYEALTSVAARSQKELRAELKKRGIAHQAFWVTNAIRVSSGPDVLDMARKRLDVREIQDEAPLTIPKPEPAPALTSLDGVEWNVARINAPQVWSTFGVRGEGIVVANVDSGVQYDHPALQAQYRGNLGDGRFDHNYNWFDPTLVCDSPSVVPCDNVGHGTHVMGTMIGDDGAGNLIGVAPHARWIAAKGCELDYCTRAALTAAAQWILAPTDLGGANPRPELRPQVVNNSWSSPGGDAWFQGLVQAWVAAGIFPAFANGNRGPACSTSGSPGDYPESYSTGASDVDDAIASFSSRGPSSLDGAAKPDIVAPGVSVRSSVPASTYGTDYASLSGTSMASPHTAATVALMWSAAPGLLGRIDDSRALLDQSAVDEPDLQCGGSEADNGVWGEGRLDAFAAVQGALSGSGPVGALGGLVTDASTGLPLAGATVRAVGPIRHLATTAANGTYRFPALPVGSYELTAAATAHASRTATASVTEGGASTQDFALAPVPHYRVEGHVRDGAGSPVANAAVTLLGAPALTDATGHYGFAQVPAGAYEVRVEHRCFVTVARPLAVGGEVTGLDFSLPERSDAFGYTCRDAAPVYVEARTVLNLDGDTTRAQIALPFPFTFYGGTYESAWLCVNGMLSFGNQRCDAFNLQGSPLPSGLAPNNTVYAFWDSLSVPRGSVRSELVGAAPDRRFVIEWRNVGVFNSAGGRIDFEIVLHEDGRIVLQYRNVADHRAEKGNSATIGIENADGTNALMYSFNQAAIVDPEHAVSYRPPPAPSLVGTVTDANDGAPLGGAAVEVRQAGSLVQKLTTDVNGVYYLRLGPGEYDVVGSQTRYRSELATVILAGDGRHAQDFALATPVAELDPPGLAFTLPAGSRRRDTLTLRNRGGLALAWRMSEIAGAAEASPAGSLIRTWTPAPWPRAVGYDGHVWVSASDDGRNHQFTTEGAATGVVWPGVGGAPVDVAYDAGRGWMCHATASPPAAISCWDPATGMLTGSILGVAPWASPLVQGLAYRADDDTFYVASGVGTLGSPRTLFHVAGFSHPTPGAVLGHCALPNDASGGLAWNPAFGSVWTAATGANERIDALDPDTCVREATLTPPGPSCCINGLDTDESGNLWIGDTNPRAVHLIESGLPAPADVRWLSASATTGTVGAGEEEAIELTADATGLAPGTYSSELVVRTNAARVRNLRLPVTLVVPEQSPYGDGPFAVPGAIPAEDFDRGGEGVAYHDLVPGNAGGLYRIDEDVDIISPHPGRYVVNNLETGEWLEYTIDVTQAGTYRLETLASSEFDGSRWRVEIDGVDRTGPVTVPNTGSWRRFRWVGVAGVSLSPGPHVLRLLVEQEYFNLDALRLRRVRPRAPAGG